MICLQREPCHVKKRGIFLYVARVGFLLLIIIILPPSLLSLPPSYSSSSFRPYALLPYALLPYALRLAPPDAWSPLAPSGR